MGVELSEKKSGGGCPINHNSPSKTTTKPSSSWRLFQWSSNKNNNKPVVVAASNNASEGGGCPVKHSSSGGGCPVKHDRVSKKSSPFAIPSSLEQAANYTQTPQPDQQHPLSTYRSISTIPRGENTENEKSSSSHSSPEEEKDNKWIYPSEQQFYNALRRKGWEGVEEKNMPLVVRIHNAVNERGWSHIRRWESTLHSNDDPKLLKFMGRPKDISPRAFVYTYLLGYHPPFDRHDWYVEAQGQEPRRYVIDFYSGSDNTSTSDTSNWNIFSMLLDSKDRKVKSSTTNLEPNRPPSMYLDVRPAMDTPYDVYDRFQMSLIDTFPGIYHAFFKPKTSSPVAATRTRSSQMPLTPDIAMMSQQQNGKNSSGTTK